MRPAAQLKKKITATNFKLITLKGNTYTKQKFPKTIISIKVSSNINVYNMFGGESTFLFVCDAGKCDFTLGT